MLRIGYFGDGPWASRAIEHIAARPDIFHIAFITPRYDTQDPALRDWAARLGVPFLPHEDINTQAFLADVAQYQCDIFVSMSFNQIMKPAFLEAVPKGVINCHAGALPFYRGRNPLNWALINGETQFGVTVHTVDEGIDTGDIIVQHMVDIADDDTYADLLEKAHGACADALLEALRGVEDGSASRTKQPAQGTYFGRRHEGDEWIDWRWDSRRIYNFIRAITTPGPGARSMIGDEEIVIYSAQMIVGAHDYIATCGEVVGRSDAGCIVKCGDNTILITKVSQAGGDAFIPRWRIGTRFRVSV